MSFFSLFILVLISFQASFALDFSQTAMCDGNVLCTKDCLKCNLCNATTCSLPNCYCASKNIPGGISLADTPQFFSITFDDSVHETTAWSLLSKINVWRNNARYSLVDSNGCKVRPTIYAMGHFSDFGFISYLNNIGEISIHSTTHTTSFYTTYRKFKNELTTCYNDIAELAQIIPKGSRAPYLETNDDYFQVLKELGISYDSSSVYFARSYNSLAANQRNWWPFTLDFGYPEASIGYTSALQLKNRIPGIWAVPMIGFQYADGTEYEIMDYTISPTFLADFKRDFDLNYNTNRAPTGLYFHASYFMNDDLTADDTTKLELYADLINWVVTQHDHVLFATPQRVINWMKNPKTLANTKLMTDFQCPVDNIAQPCAPGVPKTSCTITGLPWNTCQDECPDGTYTFNICGDQCPNKMPDIDTNWAYTGGKTRVYPAPTLYFDPTTPQTNSGYFTWKGTAYFDTPFNSVGYKPSTGTFTKNGYFCANIII